MKYYQQVVEKLKQHQCVLKSYSSKVMIFTCKCGKEDKFVPEYILRETWIGCHQCNDEYKEQCLIDKYKSALNALNLEFVSFERKTHTVVYKCEHGEFNTRSNQMLANEFKKCPECIKKHNIVKPKLTRVRKSYSGQEDYFKTKLNGLGYEYLGVNFDERIVMYKCKHTTHQTTITYINTKRFKGKCAMCKHELRNPKSIKNSSIFVNENITLERGEWQNIFPNITGKEYRAMIRNCKFYNIYRDVTVISHPNLASGYTYKEVYVIKEDFYNIPINPAEFKDENITSIENEHYEIVKGQNLYRHEPKNKYTKYIAVGTRYNKKHLHNVLYPEYKEIDHIDRNGLNNLRYNIRDGSNCVNANNKRMPKNNTSGIRGVRFEDGVKPRWKCQWNINGKRYTKSFSSKKYGFEEAKKMAIEYIEKVRK